MIVTIMQQITCVLKAISQNYSAPVEEQLQHRLEDWSKKQGYPNFLRDGPIIPFLSLSGPQSSHKMIG